MRKFQSRADHSKRNTVLNNLVVEPDPFSLQYLVNADVERVIAVRLDTSEIPCVVGIIPVQNIKRLDGVRVVLFIYFVLAQ